MWASHTCAHIICLYMSQPRKRDIKKKKKVNEAKVIIIKEEIQC